MPSFQSSVNLGRWNILHCEVTFSDIYLVIKSFSTVIIYLLQKSETEVFVYKWTSDLDSSYLQIHICHIYCKMIFGIWLFKTMISRFNGNQVIVTLFIQPNIWSGFKNNKQYITLQSKGCHHLSLLWTMGGGIFCIVKWHLVIFDY